MMESLPYKGFEWINDFNITKLSKDINIGYIIECDLTYPEHLHDLHNDYPWHLRTYVLVIICYHHGRRNRKTT